MLCVRVHVYVCVCACTHVCMCACAHVCMCACVHVCACACVRLRVRACECVCLDSHTAAPSLSPRLAMKQSLDDLESTMQGFQSRLRSATMKVESNKERA